ncbi:MAG TPA: 16S rRNA (adenine(1518)-N(6)/adenine(1519)-N(6))-dimethyltransferase RsmA [Candidatus Paceibacterota bacterium]|nr:16S rRNA (adenine(1518)-N(6)/adenine(1519)-N(6))-dimethyltransferase RsmA [Candidatus Paceibacterota bacterium]
MSPQQSLTAKKSLGQHFLNNTHVPRLMVEAGNVTRDDIVVEIGPGTGVLTRALLATGATVIALEADSRAISLLHEMFRDEITAQKLVISLCDVRTLDIRTLGLRAGGYKVVANIPYYLSGMLFRIFLEHETHPSDLVFLVQKEVAERIVRDPKESILSLSVKVFGEPRYVKTVGKGNFTPPPKIDSAIIAVSRIRHDVVQHVGARFFFETLHVGFRAKRKQLLGNLCAVYPREALSTIFHTLNLDLTIRAEDVSLDAWLTLCAELQKIK